MAAMTTPKAISLLLFDRLGINNSFYGVHVWPTNHNPNDFDVFLDGMNRNDLFFFFKTLFSLAANMMIHKTEICSVCP